MRTKVTSNQVLSGLPSVENDMGDGSYYMIFTRKLKYAD